MKPLAAVPTPTEQPKPKRMTLANVVSGRREAPMRVIVYGIEGIGKSTFSAGAPAPIFIGAEDGTAQLDVARFPEPKVLGDVFDAIDTLRREDHSYKTLVIDSLDWLEPIVWKQVIDEAGVSKLDKVGGGYNKGYDAAVEKWRELLGAIDELRHAKNMHVVFIAHASVKTFLNPEGDDYDQYILRMHHKAAGIIQQWGDAVLFAQYETHTVENEQTKRSKGFSTGRRVLYTEKRAAFFAKNRFALPGMVPLSWSAFEDAMKERNPRAIRTRCEEMIAKLEDETKKKAASEYLAKIGEDLHKLNECENRLKEMTK